MKISRLFITVSLLLCSVYLIACDDSDETDNGSANGPISSVTNAAELDALFLQIAELQCNAACDLVTRLTGDLCRDIILLELRSDRADYLDAMENGRLEFNADFYQCAYNIFSSENACSISTRDMCEGDLFTGKVSEGGNCYRDRECRDTEAGVGYCTFAEEDDYACNVGTCAIEADSGEMANVTVMEGEPCGPQSDEVYHECAGNLVCDDNAEMPVCVRTQEVAEGETCDNVTKFCVNGLSCLPQDETFETYVCQPLGALNATCSRYQPCDISHYCDLGPQGMPGTCKARIADGQACVAPNSIDLDDSPCTWGSMCIDEVCRPSRFEGEACDVSGQCRGRADQYSCENNICSKVCE